MIAEAMDKLTHKNEQTHDNSTKRCSADLESFHVFVLNAVDLLQEVAEAVDKLFLFEGLDDVVSFRALLDHRVHDMGVACMLCQHTTCKVSAKVSVSVKVSTSVLTSASMSIDISVIVSVHIHLSSAIYMTPQNKLAAECLKVKVTPTIQKKNVEHLKVTLATIKYTWNVSTQHSLETLDAVNTLSS